MASCRRSEALNVQVDPSVFGQLQEAAGANFTLAIKNCLYLATGIMPLLMLVPKKYGEPGYRRDHIIAVHIFTVSHHLLLIGIIVLGVTGQYKASTAP